MAIPIRIATDPSSHKPQPLSDQVHHADYSGCNRLLFEISPRWIADEARFIAVNDFGFNPKSAAVTLRKAAERGRDGRGAVIATSTAVGWQYHEDALRAWLSDPTMHKRGPEPRSTQAETDILDNR